MQLFFYTIMIKLTRLLLWLKIPLIIKILYTKANLHMA